MKRTKPTDEPESWTANVSFGGKDHKTLFITASTGFTRFKPNTAEQTRRSEHASPITSQTFRQ